jgi:hypothetical protein
MAEQEGRGLWGLGGIANFAADFLGDILPKVEDGNFPQAEAPQAITTKSQTSLNSSRIEEAIGGARLEADNARIVEQAVKKLVEERLRKRDEAEAEAQTSASAQNRKVRFAEADAEADAEAEAARAEARVKAEARARAEDKDVARNEKFSDLKMFFSTSTAPTDPTDTESQENNDKTEGESLRLLARFKELTNPRQESTNHNKRSNTNHLAEFHDSLKSIQESVFFFNDLHKEKPETQIKFYIKLIDYYDSEFLKKEKDQSDQSHQYYKDIADIQKDIEVYKDRAIELLDEYKTKKISSFKETPYYEPSSPDKEQQQGQGLIIGPVTEAPPAKSGNIFSSFISFLSYNSFTESISRGIKVARETVFKLIDSKFQTEKEIKDEEDDIKAFREMDVLIFGKSPEKEGESLIDFLNGKIEKLKANPDSLELKTSIYKIVDDFVKKGSSDPKSPNFSPDERRQRLQNRLGANCVHVVDRKTNQQFFPTIKSEEEIESEKLKELDDSRKLQNYESREIKVLKEDFFDKNKQFKSDFIIDGKFEIRGVDKEDHKSYFNSLIEDELTAVIKGDKSTPLRERLHEKLSKDLTEKYQDGEGYKQKFCDHLDRFSLSKIPEDIEREIIKDAQKDPEKYLFTNDRLRDLLQTDLHTLKIHKVIDDFSIKHKLGDHSLNFVEREAYRDGETKFKSGINYVIDRFQELSDQYLYRKEFVNDCKSAIKQLQEISESYEGLNKSGTSVKAEQKKQEKSPIPTPQTPNQTTDKVELNSEEELRIAVRLHKKNEDKLSSIHSNKIKSLEGKKSRPLSFKEKFSITFIPKNYELTNLKKAKELLENNKLRLERKIISNYQEILNPGNPKNIQISGKDNLKPLSNEEKMLLETALEWEKKSRLGDRLECDPLQLIGDDLNENDKGPKLFFPPLEQEVRQIPGGSNRLEGRGGVTVPVTQARTLYLSKSVSTNEVPSKEPTSPLTATQAVLLRSISNSSSSSSSSSPPPGGR